MRRAICLVAITKGRILLVRKGSDWMLPGGKPERGEINKDCLQRELSEELPGANCEIKKKGGVFRGIAPRKGYHLQAVVYFGHISGDIQTGPGDTVTEARWVSWSDIQNLQLSDTTKKIIMNLHKQGYL